MSHAAAASARSQWLHSPDALLQVLCLVAFNGHPAWNFASLTRAFRGDEALWGCIKDRRWKKANGRNFFMASARRGDVERTRWLVERGADVNAHNESRCKKQSAGYTGTSLMMACKEGHLEVVRLLLSSGADVNAAVRMHPFCGQTSLMIAARQGHLEVVRELLREQDIEIEAEDSEGNTPLMEACAGGCVEIVCLLMSQGALITGIQLREEDGLNVYTSSLTLACEEGHLEVVRELLERKPIAQRGDDECNDEVIVSLLLACRNGHVEIVRELLGHGVSIEALKDDDENYEDYGMTPLLVACYYGELNVVRELLGHGANVEAVHTDSGITCLSLACQEDGSCKILKALIDYGANVRTLDSDGMTPLMQVCQHPYPYSLDRVCLLLRHGSDVNAARADGMTALMDACENDCLEVAKVLLQYKASKTAVDSNGGNALGFIRTYRDTAELRELRALVKP